MHVSAIQPWKNIISALLSWSCHGCNADANDLLTRAAGFLRVVFCPLIKQIQPSIRADVPS